MNDQASTLRLMTSTAARPLSADDKQIKTEINSFPKPEKMRCLAITGGKGGVGKSNLAVNLALELGNLGKKVVLLDADFGLANTDLLCGISPKFHLGHFISGAKELEEIAVKLSEKVSLIPGGSGIEELADFSVNSHSNLFKNLRRMEENLDFMLIDTAAGIGKNVSGILRSAAEVIVVATPDPTSIVDAYATIKTILRHSPNKPISVVVNNVSRLGDAEQVFQQLNSASTRFLNHQIEFLGMIPHDSQLAEAVREQTPVVEYNPHSPASRAIRLIAKQLHNQIQQGFAFPIQTQSFWDTLTNN